MEGMIALITDAGVTVAFMAGILVLGVKYIPVIARMWQDDREEQKRYYQSRQKEYDRQMDVIAGLLKQGNAALERSNEVIRRNNDVIEADTRMHEKVINVLDRDVENLTILKESFEKHDRRAENMNIELIKMNETIKK